MTTNPLRRTIIALHTALRTRQTHPYGVHYYATCHMPYDDRLGCAGCGRPPCGGRLMSELVALLGCRPR
jgi:hypothetical protein